MNKNIHILLLPLVTHAVDTYICSYVSEMLYKYIYMIIQLSLLRVSVPSFLGKFKNHFYIIYVHVYESVYKFLKQK